MKKYIDSSSTRQFAVYVSVLFAMIGGVYLIYELRSILGLFLGACFVALLLSPLVSRLRTWRFPESLAILTTFFTVFVAIALSVSAVVPIFIDLAEDSKAYINRSVVYLQGQARTDFPVLAEFPLGLGKLVRKEVDFDVIASFILDQDRSQIITNNLLGNIDSFQNFAQKGIGQVSSLGLSFATGITSTFITLSLFLLLTFFILLERQNLLRWFSKMLPTDLGHYFRHREVTIATAIHSWLKGQLILVFLMFLLNLVGLFIWQLFGVPVDNIFALSVIAGVMEFVPYIGPVVAFLPAFLMVLVSPDVSITALVSIIVLYGLFQWIEGNVMVPWVMSRTLSLSPLYILVFTLIGGTLGGLIGVLLAIPLASILHIFYGDWMHYRRTLKD